MAGSHQAGLFGGSSDQKVPLSTFMSKAAMEKKKASTLQACFLRKREPWADLDPTQKAGRHQILRRPRQLVRWQALESIDESQPDVSSGSLGFGSSYPSRRNEGGLKQNWYELTTLTIQACSFPLFFQTKTNTHQCALLDIGTLFTLVVRETKRSTRSPLLGSPPS